MTEESNSHQFEGSELRSVLKEVYNEGYRMGFDMCKNDNHYQYGSLYWEEYEDGYHQGLAES